MKICRNVSSVERVLRVVVGGALLVLIPDIGYWGLIGLIPLVTGLSGYCPLYMLLSRKS